MPRFALQLLLALPLAAGFITAQAASLGPVHVDRYRVADAPLGRGPVAISAEASSDDGFDSALPIYERAVLEALARGGYDTASGAPGQVVEVRLSHAVLEPAEMKHKPVSGEMSAGVGGGGGRYGGWGSGFGLGLNIDLSKPRKALIGTRLDVRIKDRVNGATLWQGSADAAMRDTASGLDNAKLAARLTAALFDGFPLKGDPVAPR